MLIVLYHFTYKSTQPSPHPYKETISQIIQKPFIVGTSMYGLEINNVSVIKQETPDWSPEHLPIILGPVLNSNLVPSTTGLWALVS